MLQVELETQSLVLILYLVCKLYLGHVVTIMTSSIQILRHLNISDKV